MRFRAISRLPDNGSKPGGCGREIFRDGARPRGAAARTHARSFDPGLSRTHKPLVVMSTVVSTPLVGARRARVGAKGRASARRAAAVRPVAATAGEHANSAPAEDAARVAVAALASVVVALPAVRVLPRASHAPSRPRAVCEPNARARRTLALV